MKNFNYKVGTQLSNINVEGLILTITNLTDKKVSFKLNNGFIGRGGKGVNKLVTITNSIKEFENNISEGRLIIIK